MVNIVEAEYMLEVTERGTIVLFRRKMRMQDELAWREHIFLEGGIPRSPKRPPMSRACEAFHEWYGLLSFLSHVTLLPRIQ